MSQVSSSLRTRSTPAVRMMTPMPSRNISVSWSALSYAISRSVAGNAARDAAGARVVRHQDDEASGQADERGQGRALGAAFLFLDLDDDVLAFLQDIT